MTYVSARYSLPVDAVEYLLKNLEGLAKWNDGGEGKGAVIIYFASLLSMRCIAITVEFRWKENPRGGRKEERRRKG